MRILRAVVVLSGLAVAAWSGGVAPAGAATTEIGAVDEIRAATLPSDSAVGGFVVQIAEASGTYAVPSAGTITAWSHSAGTGAGALTFKVYRPTGRTQEFIAVASDTRMVAARSVQTFTVNIPVQAGDRLGLSADDVQLAFESSNASDRIGFFGSDPPPGATLATDGEPFPEFKLDVSATVQTAPAGTPAGGEPTPYAVEPPAPAITQLRVSPRAFAAARSGASARAAKRGAVVSYTASVAAKVRFTVRRTRPGRRTTSGRCVAPAKGNRTRARCRRTTALKGSFARAAAAGANRFRFTGRLGGRTLKPGTYTLVATPAAQNTTGKAVGTGFRVIR